MLAEKQALFCNPGDCSQAEWILRLCHDLKRWRSTNVPWYLKWGHTQCSKVYNRCARILVRPKGRFSAVVAERSGLQKRGGIMDRPQFNLLCSARPWIIAWQPDFIDSVLIITAVPLNMHMFTSCELLKAICKAIIAGWGWNSLMGVSDRTQLRFLPLLLLCFFIDSCLSVWLNIFN